jgi:hypothetical protein
MSYARGSVLLSREEQAIAWRLLLVFCLLYVYELANFNLTIDDEFLAQSASCQFADIGRWVHPLLRSTLWPQVVVPGAPLLLFGAAFAVSFVYLARLFGITRFEPVHYAAFVAYATFPSWIAQIEYAANVLPNAIGVWCVGVAALQTVPPADRTAQRPPWRQLGLAVVVCAVAIGAYQSLALMYLALVLGAGIVVFLARPAPDWHGLWATGWRALVVLALAFGLSLGIGRLTMALCGVQPSDYGYSFIDAGQALRHPVRALGLAINEVRRLYFSYWRPFGAAATTYLATVLLCVYAAVRLSRPGTRWWMAVALTLLLLIPAGLSFVSANTMTVRTFFASAAVLLCLLLIANALARTTVQRRLVLVLAVLCGVQGLYVNAVQQARGWSVARHDLLLAGAIHAELMRLHGAADGTPIFVSFRGERVFKSLYPLIPTSSAGASFFGWDGGDQSRIVAYMNLIGYADLRAYPEPAPGAFDAEYARMPIWPAAGSIRRVGTGYLVRLGETRPARP